ncbi:MAG: M1 family metallopeptidase [Bacteroidia bacterium]|nr:M1 family metallopeptidase [Bacteroidia bacterium]
MKRFFILIIPCLLASTFLFAQTNEIPPIGFGPWHYKSAQNPYYWKNRKPHAAYWQQDIYYNINATLDDKTGIIDGTEELTYWNNSPDTLYFVYFHLYQNAFVKGSHLEELNEANHFHQQFGPYEAQGKGTEIETLLVEDVDTITRRSNESNGLTAYGESYTSSFKPLKYDSDNTIIKVYLTEPLYPAKEITFKIKFKTYFDAGDQRRRMKKFITAGSSYTHYDGVHWYPRICVYDAKFGWDTYQHLGKEFYGDYGAYDVALTLANHYVLDATGVLQNRSEVMPDDLRAKLDIANFKNKPIGSPASEIIKPDGTTKTWKFHADNVHDFAWTADPTYRIGETEWNGIKCIALAQESNAAGWQDAASFTARVIQTYSRDFGLYAYPKMIVADARDGMEYPMLTLNGGNSPGNHFVIAHEVGHNWFFGMVGNNETYRAALDEGFTQFLTSWSLKAIDGVNNPDDKFDPYSKTFALSAMYYKQFKKKYNKRFDMDLPIDESTLYLGYLTDAMNKNDAQLNTHSDDFSSALGHGGGYRHVYYKTATMLSNLQYVLGDSLFIAAMSHYFNQWKICHPYFDDFRNSIIQFTHVDLNWFFDEWMETTKRVDYSVKTVKQHLSKKRTRLKDGPNTFITFTRKGEMQMPVDFAVITEKKDTLRYTIPNTYFAKHEKNVTVLKQWYGWDKLNESYTASISVPGKIKNVMIDPSYRLADINWLNNSKKCPVYLRFDSKVNEPIDRKHYLMHWRPDIWYNSVDGVKAGVHLNGHYMNYRHIFSAWLWYNTGAARVWFKDKKELVNYYISYRTAIDKNLFVYGESKILDGLIGNKAGLEKTAGSNRFGVYFKGMYRNNMTRFSEYNLARAAFAPNMRNNSLNLEAEHTYQYRRGNGKILLQLRSSALYTDYDYQYARLEVINHNRLGKIDVRTRTFGQYITGTSIAPESYLYLDGGNGEEMMESKYYRSELTDLYTMDHYSNNGNLLGFGGGLNLRGYNLAVVPEVYSGTSISAAHKGKGGGSVNIELEYDRLLKFAPKLLRNTFKLDAYLFADAGYIKYQVTDITGITLPVAFKWSDLKADAGAGFLLTIKRFGRLATVEPLTFRVDFPLYVRQLNVAGSNYGNTNMVIAIGRAF